MRKKKDVVPFVDSALKKVMDELGMTAPLAPPPGEVAPQVCPNCEELRRKLLVILEMEEATKDYEQYRSFPQPLNHDELREFSAKWNAATERWKRANIAYHELLDALSTLNVQEPTNG